MRCLKSDLQLSLSERSVSSINPILASLFWPYYHIRAVRGKLLLSYFFWRENCYLLTGNLAHILSNLNAFKKAIKTFLIWHGIFY